MCQKPSRKIKKGSQVTRQREARRLLRRQNTVVENSNAACDSTTPDAQQPQKPTDNNDYQAAHAAAQKRVLLELAWRTISLLERNNLIQQKIMELHRETRQYVASVLNNPEDLSLRFQHARFMAQQQTNPTPAPNESGVNLENPFHFKRETE